MDLQKLLEAGP